MTRNLQARVAKLEEARGRAGLPDGALLCVLLKDGETEERARERIMRQDRMRSLSPAARCSLVLVFISQGDARC